MATLSELISRIQGNVIDLTQEVLGRTTEKIIEAQRRAEDRHYFRIMEAEISVATVNQQRQLALTPSDWVDYRARPYYIDGLGGVTQMDWLHTEDEKTLLYSTPNPLAAADPNVQLNDQGSPRHIWWHTRAGADVLDVYPLPDTNNTKGPYDATGNYTVVVPYWQRELELGTTILVGGFPVQVTTNWFTDNAEYYLEWYATAELLLINRDFELAGAYSAKAEQELLRIVRDDKKKRIGREATLRPRTGALSPAGSRQKRRGGARRGFTRNL